jgi:hypothetical protein
MVEQNRSILTMNHDTPDGSRLPPSELIQHGVKRIWNDEATAGRTGIGGRTTTNGRTSSSSKRARFNILEQFGSISVRDDDMDNDQVGDNSFSSLCATDKGKYNNGNGSSMVDGFSTENDDDEVGCDDSESSSGPDDDDDELLSDEELLRRRLEKQVYVYYYSGVEYVFDRSHFMRSFVFAEPRSFHKLALGRGADADATADDPVERKFAQIVLQCMMKEAAVTAARQDSSDHIHDTTSPPARSRWCGAAAAVDPSFPSTTTSGGGDAANVPTTAWSQQLESMDLD